MNLNQEAHISYVRHLLAVDMQTTKKVYEPLYEKVRMARGRHAWSAQQTAEAESIAHQLGAAVTSHGTALLRTQDLPVIVREGRPVPKDVEAHEVLVLADQDNPPPGMSPSEVGRVMQIAQTLWLVGDSLKRLSIAESASEGKKLSPPISMEEYFLYGKYGAVLRRGREAPTVEFERDEKPYGFEFARAGMLRALKVMFVVTADIRMVELRVPAHIALAYLTDSYTEQAQRELHELMAKYRHLGGLEKRGELYDDVKNGIPGAARELVNYVARETAVKTGKFCEVIDASDRNSPTVLFTASPHSNVIEYTIEMTMHKAHRVANPRRGLSDAKILTSWIRWVEE
jgi:hypothetical protein